MKRKSNPPFAPNLIESMRSIGYSFDTALADIVDNSISAKATKIEINSTVNNGKPYISIFDNGFGMNDDELFLAMKYGSYNPNDIREKNDMGRFGLGLKSASLSQCRKLTVVSKKDDRYSAYIWDVDFVIENGEWVLQELEENEIFTIPNINKLQKYKSGTIVLWQEFDKIKSASNNLDETLKELLVSSIDHLALVYHRLIGKKVKITVNGFEVIPRDPFLENHKGTQLKREQTIVVDNSKIKIKPYILPHVNKLSKEDIIKLGGKESLRTDQGFYIYRNKRLIIWGTWFRLGTKNELSKLARVKVDIPNDIDYLWDIDIKKSHASLPERIKVNLYNAVYESCGLSENVHNYRGKRVTSNEYIRTWNIIEYRKGEGLKLEVNFDNPIIQAFINTLDETQKKVFVTIMEDIEDGLPYDYIYSQIAKGKKTELEITEDEKKEIIENIKVKIKNLEELGMTRNEVLEILMSQEKYASDVYFMEKLKEMRGK